MTKHFGNPLGEQRQLLAGKAAVHRVDQQVLLLAGDDALSWLHSITSQNIKNLKPGECTETLVLTPTGHIEHQIKVLAFDGGLYLIVNAEKVEALTKWLNMMRFRSKVTISEADLEVWGGFGDLALSDLVWVDHFDSEPKGSVRYAQQVESFPYREYLLPVGQKPDLEEAGFLALEALRIDAGRPEITDIDERSLPHEYDWLASAVHLSKGCYRGQETVAKVHNLGHPPRRLVVLNLEVGDTMANPGEEIFYQGKLVGKVLAGALHYEAGSLALGLVNRNTPYLDLELCGMTASQRVLVPADAGKAANLPRPSAFKLSGKK
jgi:folate-binding protein YgfZ